MIFVAPLAITISIGSDKMLTAKFVAWKTQNPKGMGCGVAAFSCSFLVRSSLFCELP